MELAAGDSGLAQVGDDPVDEAGRAADVDVALGDVGDELTEVGRGEQVASLGVPVVADDVLDPRPPGRCDPRRARRRRRSRALEATR